MISSDVSFVEIDLQIWFTIVVAYATTAMLTSNTFGPNFMLPLIITFFGWVYGAPTQTITNCWPIVIGTLLGTMLAVVFFEAVYRRFVEVLRRELREEKELKEI